MQEFARFIPIVLVAFLLYTVLVRYFSLFLLCARNRAFPRTRWVEWKAARFSCGGKKRSALL